MPVFDHFLLGYWNGRYRLLKSAGVDKVISAESLSALQRLGAPNGKELVTTTTLCKDKLFAVSYLRQDKDEYDRATVWNHTILIPCDAIISSLKELKLGDVFIKQVTGNLASPLPPVSLNI